LRTRAQSAPNHDAVPLPADFVNVAFNKDAFPTRQPLSPANQSSACQNKPGFSCVSLQAQYQAFVRFAVASSAALSAIALNSTCVLEPFTRRGSRFENSGFHPLDYGACADAVTGT
jgi:hypothetical protein